MDGVGTFSKKMTYLGNLVGTSIIYGAEFGVAQAVGNPHRFLAYTGNRVNIYVRDAIGLYTTSRDEPGVSIGIAVGWGFTGHIAGEPNQNAVLREVDWDGDDIQASLYNPLTPFFQDSKIEYAGSAPGSGLQLGETDYNVYTFPISNSHFTNAGAASAGLQQGNIFRVIPVVARGDFMRVWFWSDPDTWTGHNVAFPPLRSDRIDIWAMSGSDVAGSQRIGGGHG